MVDFRLKAEIEKQAKIEQDRLNVIQEKLDKEIQKFINQYKLTSFELLLILNNIVRKEIGSKMDNFVAAKAQQNLAVHDKILKN